MPSGASITSNTTGAPTARLPDRREQAHADRPTLKKPYEVMRAALNKINRDMSFQPLPIRLGQCLGVGREVGGNCWRTTGDITDTWSSMSNIGFSQAGHEKFAGPGHWNDPDMLVVGMVGWGNLHPTGLTPNEQYTHISLWCLLCSPLLIGCDMTQLDDFTLNLLTNDEVLEVNQDPLGQTSPARHPRPITSKSGQKRWKTAPWPWDCLTAAKSENTDHREMVRPGPVWQTDRPRPLAAKRPRRVRGPIYRNRGPPRRGAGPPAALG